jgi:prepilin-type N-terminal cleavage/methylation domain-containing protein
MMKIINRNGFTLIEVLVALLVFAIGAVGMVKLYTYATTHEAYNEQYSNAFNVAQNQAELLKQVAHTTGLSFGTNYPCPNPSIATSSGVIFNCTWFATNFNNNVQNISVTVTWTDRNKDAQRNMTFNFIKSRNTSPCLNCSKNWGFN